MKKWKHNVNLSWRMTKYNNEEMTLEELSVSVSDYLNKVAEELNDDSLARIADEFSMCDPDDEDQFDWVLDLLYDWGDRNNEWIKTSEDL